MQPTIDYIAKELQPYYPDSEIRSLTRIILSNVLGISYTALALKWNGTLDPAQAGKVEEMVARLKQYEPIQYITGETEFYGIRLNVNPSVLIPRPETEELADWIARSVPANGTRILDIGTGSGCIALALKKILPDVDISGIDVSDDALSTARSNAQSNNLEADFFKADIFRWKEKQWAQYDVVVSNPPYVRESEKAVMQVNVLGYEPGIALFVPDSDPLVFYREIVQFSKHCLNPGGLLFFEINEAFGNEIAEMLRGNGFGEAELRRDINGKPRMVKARRF